jgi:hypothetical protein
MSFINKRTNAKSAELRGYDSEKEADAKRRLEAAGWDFASAEWSWDEAKRLFTTDAIDTKKERLAAFPSTRGAGDGDE